MPAKTTGSAASTTIITLSLIGVFLLVAFALLPRGFSSDVSVIGQGKPVVVLAHNKDSVQSFNLMDLLNKVRDDYSGTMEFRVVDDTSPQGHAFISKQQVDLGTLLLFGSDGKRTGVVSDLKDEPALRLALDSAFPTAP